MNLTYGDSIVYYHYIGATRTPAGWDDPTDVSERDNLKDAPAVKVVRGGVVLVGSGVASVYAVDGRVLFRGEVEGRLYRSLKPGVYVVRFGDRTYRITVR